MIPSEQTDFYSPRCYPHFKETPALDLKEAAWLGPPLGVQTLLFSESLFHRIACPWLGVRTLELET